MPHTAIDMRVAPDDGSLLGHILLDTALAAEPGPQVGLLLDTIDVSSLNDAQKAQLVLAWERQGAWMAARQHDAIASLCGEESVHDDTSVAIELSTSLGLGEFAIQRRMDTARALQVRLSLSQGLLKTGKWTLQHVAAIVEQTADLTDEQAAWVEAQIVAAWEKGSVRTPAQVRSRTKRAAMTVDTQRAEQIQAAEAKRVEIAQYSDGQGLVELNARLQAEDSQVVWKALTARGRQLRKAAGTDTERRDLAFWRARALVDMADETLADPSLTTFQGKRRIEVGVVVGLDTLLKLNDDPGELVGHGPIPPSVARKMATEGQWRRWVTEPVTGHLLDYGRTTYRPPQELVEFLLARDAHCVFPGCSMPAWRCELDHVDEWSKGGHTAARCMQSLCFKHHGKRTSGDLDVRRLPDGSTECSSWSGKTHLVPPREVLPRFSQPPPGDDPPY